VCHTVSWLNSSLNNKVGFVSAKPGRNTLRTSRKTNLVFNSGTNMSHYFDPDHEAVCKLIGVPEFVPSVPSTCPFSLAEPSFFLSFFHRERNASPARSSVLLSVKKQLRFRGKRLSCLLVLPCVLAPRILVGKGEATRKTSLWINERRFLLPSQSILPNEDREHPVLKMPLRTLTWSDMIVLSLAALPCDDEDSRSRLRTLTVCCLHFLCFVHL
jgi:hypothetical protein